jgi:hypothetical protein
VPEPLWDIVIKIAVDTPEEADARSVAAVLLGRMQVTPAGAAPFIQFEDGIWVTELHVADPDFEQVEPQDPLSVLSCLTADLGSVTWTGQTDTPFDPDQARAGQLDWPPGYWSTAGRKETLVHPSVRAVLLQAARRADPMPADPAGPFGL